MNKNIVSLEVSDPVIPVILRVEAAAVLTAILAAYQ
jgi:hypothetical protein